MIGKQARNVSSIKQKVLSQLNLGGNKNSVKRRRYTALFFIIVLTFQLLTTLAGPYAEYFKAYAQNNQTVGVNNNQDDPEQLNKQFNDNRVKNTKRPGPIQTKNSNFETSKTGDSKAPLATVDNTIKDQKKYREKVFKEKDPAKLKKKREKTELRTPFSNTYEAEDGADITEQGIIPINYPTKDGKLEKISYESYNDEKYESQTKIDQSIWQNIVNFFTFNDPQPKAYKNVTGTIKSDFKTLSYGGINYQTDQGAFTIHPDGAGVVIPKYLKDKNGMPYIKYQDAWPGVDLVYEYRGTSVKEYIIVRKAPNSNQFKFKLEGAKAKNVDGHIEIEGMTEGRYQFSNLSLSVNKQGQITNPPLKQFASDDGQYIIVELEQAWLKSQKNQNFPLVIDPEYVDTYIPGGYTGNFWPYKSDGYVGSSQNHNVNTGGLNDNGVKGWRTLVQLPYNHLTADKVVLGATITMSMMTNPEWWHGYYDPRQIYASWADCFSYHCVGNPGGDGSMQGTVGVSGSIDVTALAQAYQNGGKSGNWGGITMLRGEDWWGASFKEIDPRTVVLHTATTRLPNQITPELPSTDPNTEVVTTTTNPQLRVSASSDPDNDQVYYDFMLYSTSGQLLWESGRSPSRLAIVPDDILEDGSSYVWKARVDDGYKNQPVIDGGKLRVNLRNGKDRTQTYDNLGPIDTNLATGNVATAVGTHKISALGDSIGLNLTYNSPYASKYGLTGEYYNNTNWSGSPVYRRTDPNINFSWDNGTGVAGITGNDNFSVKWSGYFVAPYDGNFTFSANADDYQKIVVNGQTVVENSCCPGYKASATPVNLKAGQIVPLQFYFFEIGGGATAIFTVKSDVEPAEKIVPSEWLRATPGKQKTTAGLTSHYYYDNGSHDFTKSPGRFMTRTDLQVNFDWSTGAPTPNGPSDNFMVRWEGYFTAPTAGNYKFGTGSDDGSRLIVNNQSVVDRWSTVGNGDVYGAGLALTAGQTVPIKMEYFEQGGGASARLLWDGPNGIGVIPSQFLSKGPSVVPDGWNISADVDGNLAYERLSQRTNGDVAVYDASGGEKVFTVNSTGGYKAPINEDAILTNNIDGTFNLTARDGREYVFNIDGTLKQTSIPPDDRKPAALGYEYSTSNGIPKLKRIIDGVDPSRNGTLLYKEDGNCQTSPSGFDPAPPVGMLCGFETYDGQKTAFYYKNSQLARISLPGNADYNLGYDTNGMLTTMRDTLASDTVTAGLRADDSSVTTELSYDSLARLSSVTGAAPTGGSSRPKHTFEYGIGNTKSHIESAPEPVGYLQKVEYDSLLRTTKLCDNRGQCSVNEWDPVKDLLLSTTDSKNLKSTTIYDSNDNPITQYGPALASHFGADRKPSGWAGFSVPVKVTRYDENINGPAVAYYNYKAVETSSGPSGVLFGTPKIHTTGINANQSVFSQNWASPPTTADAGMAGWGMSASGRLTFATAGNYILNITSNDGVKVWIDDNLVINDWNAGASRNRSYTLNAEANKNYRFRLEYFDLNDSTPASLNFTYTAPGKTPTNNFGSYLKPFYNLATSTTIGDWQAGNIDTKTTYQDPALGMLKDSIVDPNGLNLITSATYETPGNGYLRQTSKTLPGGGDKYKYNYYGATETADNPCTLLPEAYRQAGRIKNRTNPAGIVNTNIYDDAGKVVAYKLNNDPWTCFSFDERGRPIKTVVPSLPSKAGRTTEVFNSYGGNPLVVATNDSLGGLTLVESDLMGRTVRSVDGYSNETKITYNSLGQIEKKTSPLGVEEFSYDDYGSIKTQKLDGVEYAKPIYDGYGRLSAVDYTQAKATNGSITKLRQVKYDGYGRDYGLWLTLPDNTAISTTDTFSQSNRITTSKLTYAGKTATSEYKYDKAGRLTQATVDNWKFNYGFENDSQYCKDAIAAQPLLAFANNSQSAKAGNRSSTTITNTVDGQATTTNSCYSYKGKLYKNSDKQVGGPWYDDHGNTTRLDGDGKAIVLNYDATERNTQITQGNYKIVYTRDVAGSIIAKKEYTDNKLSASYRYYAGGAVVASCTLTGTIICSTSERKLNLPGNVTLTLRNNQPNPELASTYTVKNKKGESMLEFTSNGKPIGTANLYDPFGGQLYSNTFNKVEDIVVSSKPHISLGIAQYGKRLYVASLGRFLQIDPVEGGTDNDYAYVNDPVNNNDFTGEMDSAFQWGVCVFGCTTSNALRLNQATNWNFQANQRLLGSDQNGTSVIRSNQRVLVSYPWRAGPVVLIVPRNYSPTPQQWAMAAAANHLAVTAGQLAAKSKIDVPTFQQKIAILATIMLSDPRMKNELLFGISPAYTIFRSCLLDQGSEFCQYNIDKLVLAVSVALAVYTIGISVQVGAAYLSSRFASLAQFMNFAKNYTTFIDSLRFSNAFLNNLDDAESYLSKYAISDISTINTQLISGRDKLYPDSITFMNDGARFNDINRGNNNPVSQIDIDNAKSVASTIKNNGNGIGVGDFMNRDFQLPYKTSSNSIIKYTEYKLNTLSPADSQRLVFGTDGSVYYTPDHYGQWWLKLQW